MHPRRKNLLPFLNDWKVALFINEPSYLSVKKINFRYTCKLFIYILFPSVFFPLFIVSAKLLSRQLRVKIYWNENVEWKGLLPRAKSEFQLIQRPTKKQLLKTFWNFSLFENSFFFFFCAYLNVRKKILFSFAFLYQFHLGKNACYLLL